jgi:List-Bact-rpt repeat protein
VTTYASVTVVNLTAIPDPPSDFAGWSGAADCTDASVTLNTNTACTATFNLQQGTFAYLGNRGSNISKSSGTTVTVTPTTTASQTNLLIVRAQTDNVSTTSGQTSDHKSVTDTLGNQYIKLGEQTRSGGVAGSGVTTSLWASRPFASVTTNNTVTLTTGTAVVAKAISLEEYMLAANTTFSSVSTANTGSNGTSTTPSAVFSGLSNVLRLFVGLLGIEGPNTDGYTQSVNYASGTTNNGTTGGASTTNVSGRFGFRRQTATGDTFAPTISPAENWALVYSSLATAPAVNSASLTLTNSGTGGGTLIGAGTFYNGTNVQIQAIPNGSSQFGGWTTVSGNDCTNATNTIVNFGLSTNTTCNAVFTLAPPPPPQNYTLTITTSGTGAGTTTGAGVYASGTVVNLTATPNSQSTFDGWTPSVCTTGSVTMTADTTCNASFTLLPLATMTTVNTGTGLGTTTGAGTYFQGQNAILTATPNTGSVFAGWSGSSGCTGTVSPLTVLMDTSKTCTATYNVSGPGPVGVITPTPFKRCTVSYVASLSSGGPIATVQWKVDGVNTKSSTSGVPMLQTTAPFVFTKSLVLNGALVSADVTDTGGQTSTFGPVQVSCP